MSDMIERCAIALAADSYPDKPWEDYSDLEREDYRGHVRAVFGTMRQISAERLHGGDQALREALKVAEQALLEVHGAQIRGEDWYTQGRSGLYQQVAMWVAKGRSAISAALTLDAVSDKPE